MRYKAKKTSGSALIFTMIAIGILTAIAANSLQRSTVDSRMAGSWNKRALASEISETGLQRVARAVLDQYRSTTSINSLLGTIQMGSSGGGTYSVIIADNSSVGGVDQDGDGSTSTDSDRIFRLVATGAVGNSEQVVEAFYRIVTATTTPTIPSTTGVGAVGLCGNNFDIGDKANRISGNDYNLPGYPCTGAGCNGTNTGSVKPGVSYNTGTTVTLAGTPTGNPGVNSNAGIDCTSWTSFVANAESVAQTTLPASGGPYNAASYATQFGTDTAPKVMLIQGTGNSVTFNGNLFGNGVLIIKNCHVTFAGTFTYAGLIVIEDDGGGITIGGTAGIFGSVMVLGATAPDIQTEITINSNATNVNYSTQGVGRAQTALNGTTSSGSSSSSLSLVAFRTSSK